MTETALAPSSSERRHPYVVVVVVVTALIAAVAFTTIFADAYGADMVPLWAAAKLWAAGTPEAIYAADAGLFTMRGPDAFVPIARADGYEHGIYPFLYPPLWAALLAPLTSFIELPVLAAIFRAINAASLVLVPWLMWRAAPLVPFSRHFAVGLMLLLVTTVGLIPIMANQVQIFVAFLLALTVERSSNKGEVVAGIALGLAAALKLYPALFAVLFLGLRQPRAFIAFTVTGGALGLASLAVGGWTLHLALLDQLSVISGTVLRMNLSMNVDALIAILTDQRGVDVWPGLEAIGKSSAWVAVNRIALPGYVIALALAAWRRPSLGAHPLFWPTALLGAALLGPLSWAYYYITPLSAAPLVLALWPIRLAIAALSIVAVSVSLTVLYAVPTPFDAPPMQFWGSLALTLLWAGFLSTLWHTARRRVRPLHPARRSL